jgi:hypothetical protein
MPGPSLTGNESGSAALRGYVTGWRHSGRTAGRAAVVLLDHLGDGL